MVTQTSQYKSVRDQHRKLLAIDLKAAEDYLGKIRSGNDDVCGTKKNNVQFTLRNARVYLAYWGKNSDTAIESRGRYNDLVNEFNELREGFPCLELFG